MAIDTPARIAVLGAGPVGLEAALYARYLGYDVDVYERGQVAEHINRWGHVRMFTRFGLNCSPLGLAALKAQDARWQPPEADAILTGHEYRERYLLPLSQSDLLLDGLHLNTEVLAIGREGWLCCEGQGTEERADSDFRLLVRTTEPDAHVHERYAAAEAVLDTTGTFSTPNWLGPDGLPAVGELAAQRHIEYGLPDVLGADRERYAGRSILLVGDGDSAAATLVALAQLAAQTRDTWITWLTRGADCLAPGNPMADERLVERERIRQQAARLAADDGNHITHRGQTAVEAIVWHADLDRFGVRCTGEQAAEGEYDRVIANVGYRPDLRLYEELQLDLCATTASPRTGGASGVLTSEPDFYVLGCKSRGRDTHFVIADALPQIRRVFAVIGDRADLDLYATMGKLA